jgi:hypothetical protein
MNGNNIPTDEDFERARAATRQRDRGLSEVQTTILGLFFDQGLHQIFILYSPDNDLFVTYLFFVTDDQEKASEQSGLTDQIKNSVLDELERVGRGKRSSLKVNFEIDTDENVQKKYDGDYYARLR